MIYAEHKKVFVLMSGGVDSSTAALLLKNDGWDVSGVTMEQLHPGQAEPAAQVCAGLGIPHYSFDLIQEFKSLVVSKFYGDYGKGLTPNPCVTCNAAVKFGLLNGIIAEKILGDPDAEFKIATGHYAKITSGPPGIARAANRKKDQSYFLCMVPASLTEKILFPLGEYSKDEVRAIARKNGIAAAERPDSMEICFMGEGGYRKCPEIDSAPGIIEDEYGGRLGEHRGIHNYTIGQRKGLGIPSRHGLYVIALDAENNRVIVGEKEKVMTDTVCAEAVNYFSEDSCAAGAGLLGKVRSQGEPAECVVVEQNGGFIKVCFAQKLLSPAPGQFLALYGEEGRLAAGGVIFLPG